MKNFFLNYIGTVIIVAGVVLFCIDYFCKVNSNAMLIIGLAAVIIGVFAQVWSMKR